MSDLLEDDETIATEETGEPTEAETALLSKFTESLKIPAYLETWYDRFEEDRAYVNEDCMLIDEEDTVATNYILRNQYVVGNQINFKDPAVGVSPIEQLWGIAPMTGEEQTVPPQTIAFAATNRILLNQQIRWMNFKRVMNGASQDAMTVGISYLKLRVQEDHMRDPIGYKREDDHLDNVKRLQRLQKEFTEEAFDDSSEQYQEMVDLMEQARQFLQGEVNEQMRTQPVQQIPIFDPMTGMPALDEMGQQRTQSDPNDPRMARLAQIGEPGAMLDMTLLPEVPHYIGYTLEQVLPEDVRFDFGSVIRPEDFYDSETVHSRVYMDKDTIKDKWGVTDEYFTKMKGSSLPGRFSGKKGRARGSDEDPGKRRDIEADQLDGKYAVWETQHRPTGTVYVWIAGCRGFLTKYVPEVTWHKWFNIFPVYFNRVTGRFLPISDTRLVMQLQDEANTIRTHEREARKSSYPRFIVKAGLFSKKEKDKFERAAPYSITEAQKADQIKDSIHEVAPVKFVAQLYDISKTTREMELMMGVPQQAAGAVGGAKFATETAIADKQMAVQSDNRRSFLDDTMGDIVTAMSEMNNILYDEERVKQIVGPGAYWPALGRTKLFFQVKIEIIPGSSGRPDVDKKLKVLQDVTAVIANLSAIPLINLNYVVPEILKAAEMFELDPKKMFIAPPLMGPPMSMPGASSGGKGTPAPKSGPQGGAPPMSDPRGPVNMPGSVATQLAS